MFQSELIMGEQAFRRLFPGQDGYRVFLLDVAAGRRGRRSWRGSSRASPTRASTPPPPATASPPTIASRTPTCPPSRPWAALGLVLGTVGLATVLLRNALERRREIALLRALGYRPGHVSGMLLAENAALLGLGVGAGLVPPRSSPSFPAVMQRGGVLPLGAIARGGGGGHGHRAGHVRPRRGRGAALAAPGRAAERMSDAARTAGRASADEGGDRDAGRGGAVLR